LASPADQAFTRNAWRSAFGLLPKTLGFVGETLLEGSDWL
jgi:hypothetical protein